MLNPLAIAVFGGVMDLLPYLGVFLTMIPAVLMLVEELRVVLPGEAVQPGDIEQRRQDDHTEREYHRRAESMPAAQAGVEADAKAAPPSSG